MTNITKMELTNFDSSIDQTNLDYDLPDNTKVNFSQIESMWSFSFETCTHNGEGQLSNTLQLAKAELVYQLRTMANMIEEHDTTLDVLNLLKLDERQCGGPIPSSETHIVGESGKTFVPFASKGTFSGGKVESGPITNHPYTLRYEVVDDGSPEVNLAYKQFIHQAIDCAMEQAFSLADEVDMLDLTYHPTKARELMAIVVYRLEAMPSRLFQSVKVDKSNANDYGIVLHDIAEAVLTDPDFSKTQTTYPLGHRTEKDFAHAVKRITAILTENLAPGEE